MVVGVIGQGTMGAGIAQVAAQNECIVVAFDTQENVLQKAANSLEMSLTKLVEKQKITGDKKTAIQKNIAYSTDINALANCDLIIEAIVENIEVKKKVFAQLESIVSDNCILASNTSSLSLTSIAASCKLAHRVIGIHFFNPAPIMALVEIIPAIQTAETIITQTEQIINAWGKTTVIAKDTPGFIVNRIARPFYSEAIRIFEEKNIPIAVIDKAMMDVGFKMGPFALMDLIGHDVNYVVTKTVWKEMFFDPRYKPSHTQKRLLEAGWLGKKSGRGFYNYSVDMLNNIEDANAEMLSQISNRILLMLFNEAGDAAYLNIASEHDIETAMTKGVNYPKGLLAWAKEFGHENVRNGLDNLYKYYGEDRYRCSPYFREKML
jgi:3-hydroxybutyryl-CoA dehydrogenase